MIAGLSIALAEVGLRFFPNVIPIVLLIQFNEDLQSEIAARLGYASKRAFKTIPRDDGGPPLWLPMPGQTVAFPWHDAGAVTRVVMDWRGFCNPLVKSNRNFHPDILAVGDSFTWCTSVAPEDTWASRLETVTGHTTYAIGRGGIGLHEYVQLLRAFAPELAPRLVIVNVYEGNDLRDALKYLRYAGGEEVVRPRAPEEIRLSPLGRLYFALLEGPLGRKSYAVNLSMTATNIAYAWLQGWWAETAPSTFGEPAAAGGPDFRYRVVFGDRELAFNPDNTDRDEVELAHRVAAGTVGFSAFDGALEALSNEARRQGFRLVVSYAPSAHTAYAGHATFADPELAPVLAEFSRRQRDYFARQAHELGFGFIDLAPALQAAAHTHGLDRLLYFPGNLHLTPEGHRVVAEAMGRAIKPLLP